MGIRFSPARCCCSSGVQPAWTVYHENVNPEQHILICDTFSLSTSGACIRIPKDDATYSVGPSHSIGSYCTYYSGSGASWIYRSCPPDSGLLGGPIVTISVTPYSSINLTGIYNGNTWIHPLRIEKIRFQFGSNDFSYDYDPSQLFFSESDHFCGHSEYSGALVSQSTTYGAVSVTPYIGYKYSSYYGGDYIMMDGVSGNSACLGSYVSGTISGLIIPQDSNWAYWSGISGHFGDFYSSIKDTFGNSDFTGDPVDSCTETVGYQISDNYDISFISRLLPLHLNDFSGYQYSNLSTCESGRCSLRKNLQAPVYSKSFNNTSNFAVRCWANGTTSTSQFVTYDKYHGVCSGTKFDQFLPRIDCSGIAFSGLMGDRYPITNIESGIFNYYTPFYDNPTNIYNDSCSILYDGFSTAYPVLNNYAPIIVKYPVLSYIRINHLKSRVDYEFSVEAGPCDLYLPDIVCAQNIHYWTDYKYTSKLMIASNTGVRHICDDFDINNFSVVPYNGSGTSSSSCTGTYAYLCANEEDYIDTYLYNDISVSLGEDTTSPYFISYLTGTSDLCIP